jgi:molybdenum cofactor cytidylyltransferase
VLAAGGSSRLGRPKQLLVLDGEPLVRRAARAAIEAGLAPVVVVVGAHEAEVRAALAGLPVEIAPNAAWERGMAGSVRIGVARLAAEGAGAAALLVCDQPGVTAAHLRALDDALRTSGAPIAASAYAGAHGVPAVFAASLFEELSGLAGDRGARAVIARDPSRVVAVALAGGELDVDEPGDWDRLRASRGP